MAPGPGDQPPETGDQCTVLWLQGPTLDLATKDCHPVAEHDDLDGQIGVLRPLQTEEQHGPTEGEVEEREGHGPFSRSHPLRRKSLVNCPDELLGTHSYWLSGALRSTT